MQQLSMYQLQLIWVVHFYFTSLALLSLDAILECIDDINESDGIEGYDTNYNSLFDNQSHPKKSIEMEFTYKILNS
ncbi:hypothetical protein BpHYR1_010204 [Brachionus plicatilis]|uniref:Uncharacterized protein n=1 Tax=Brachionus plicatilis TaxID=10195 RepID=A0A3M7QZX0_BRAPC|nr:hypothetical protein BpHYR1_010204 [Brachionus plicatilis]